MAGTLSDNPRKGQGLAALRVGFLCADRAIVHELEKVRPPYNVGALNQRAAASIIKSGKRLTYLEAQALIDGNRKEARKHAITEPVYTDELIEALRLSDRLAKILRKRHLSVLM